MFCRADAAVCQIAPRVPRPQQADRFHQHSSFPASLSLPSHPRRRRGRSPPSSSVDGAGCSGLGLHRQCGMQRLGRSDGFPRRGRRGLASLPTSSSYSSSVALVSAVEPAGAEGMRTEGAQIQGGNNEGRPTSPSRVAAQSSSASMACSKGSQSYSWVVAWPTVAVPLARRLHFLLVPQYPAAKLKAPVREEAGGCSATLATSCLPTSSREGLGRSIQGADALRYTPPTLLSVRIRGLSLLSSQCRSEGNQQGWCPVCISYNVLNPCSTPALCSTYKLHVLSNLISCVA